MVTEMRDWASSARCRGQGAELFFTDDDVSARGRARAFCACCPVWSQCLAEALDRRDREGMWGGLRTAERDRLRRLRQRLGRAPRDPENGADRRALERVMGPERLAWVLGESDEPVSVGRRLVG